LFCPQDFLKGNSAARAIALTQKIMGRLRAGIKACSATGHDLKRDKVAVLL
jgi:hypothetical protein